MKINIQRYYLAIAERLEKKFFLLMLIIYGFSSQIHADPFPALTVTNGAGHQETYSITLQIIAMMTAMAVLPALILTMTSFTRVVIVLGMLRQAIGMPQTPSNQILIGVALFLTFFIMAPIFNDINNTAVSPYMEGKVTFKEALDSAIVPIKGFMLHQTRETDLSVFNNLASINQKNSKKFDNLSEIPFSTLIPAFVTSELKTAFQIGFLLFIPFLIIDLVVASVLMAMGMMMLSPLIISLPFKIMLFVLVDGWNLVIGTLAASFGV
jgi:flagellar biosynthetic protein FliP